MSKKIKNILSEAMKKRLEGVENALLVNVIGLSVNTSNKLRGELATKGISLMVVKNSLAARATKESSLSKMFEGLEGSSALVWADCDIVALAKEIVRLAKDKAYAKLEIRGGVLDGEAFAAEMVTEISKWPTREEQIALLLGQIVGVGSKLSSQLLSGAKNLASQVKQLSEKEEEASAEPVEAA